MDFSLDASLSARLLACPPLLLQASSEGSDALLAEFEETWTSLCDDIEQAQSHDCLSTRTLQIAQTVTSTIQKLAAHFQNYEAISTDVRSDFHDRVEGFLDSVDTTSGTSPSADCMSETKGTSLAFAYIRPLLEYILDNIHSPYPSPEDKQRLLSEVVTAGWESATLRRLDDWMHLTRTKMGYIAILKSSAVADDRDVMEDFTLRVLSDVLEDRQGIPHTTVDAIEDMHRWVLDQYESRSAQEDASPWAQEVLGLVHRLNDPVDDESDSDSDSTDDSAAVAPYSDDETRFSDDSSDFSDTDVEPWVDEPLRGIIGTKRKYSGLQGLGFPTSSPLSRSSSSSSLSSRGRSIWSRRSSSGSTSASSVFSVDWEQEHGQETDRPTKRRRSSVELPSYDPSSPAASSLGDILSQPSPVDASSSDSLLHETTSPCSSSSPPSAQSPEPIPFPSSALFPAESPAVMAAGSLQKRKREASDDEDARPVVSKRRRHSASPPSIPMQHFGALGIIGHLPWDGPLCASSAVELELEAYALDSSPFAHGVAPEPLDDADEEVEKEDDEEENDVYDRLVDYSNERMLEEVVEDGTPGTFTWSEMQLHVLDSILSYGARPTPAATAARITPLSSPQEFRLELPSLDDADLAYLLNIAEGPSMPPPAEMISPPLPSMHGQTFDLDLDVKPPLPESDVDNFVQMLQGWTSASAACPIRLEEPAPFADAEVDKWAVDFLARAPADLMTH